MSPSLTPTCFILNVFLLLIWATFILVHNRTIIIKCCSKQTKNTQKYKQCLKLLKCFLARWCTDKKVYIYFELVLGLVILMRVVGKHILLFVSLIEKLSQGTKSKVQVLRRSLGPKHFTKLGLPTHPPPTHKLLGNFWGT